MQNYQATVFHLLKTFTKLTHAVKCVCKKRFNTFLMSDHCLASSAKLKATEFYTAVCEHFTISHKWQNWTSVVKCHNSIPGVYYAIIHRARKQIPLTWFLFNYSTWKILSALVFLSEHQEKKYLYPLKNIYLFENCVPLSFSFHSREPTFSTYFIQSWANVAYDTMGFHYSNIIV